MDHVFDLPNANSNHYKTWFWTTYWDWSTNDARALPLCHDGEGY